MKRRGRILKATIFSLAAVTLFIIVFISMFYERDAGTKARYCGQDPVLVATDIKDMDDNSLEKLIDKNLEMGLATENTKTNKITWLFKPGGFDPDEIEVVWPMASVRAFAEEIIETNQTGGVMYVGVKSRYSKGIIAIVPLRFQIRSISENSSNSQSSEILIEEGTNGNVTQSISGEEKVSYEQQVEIPRTPTLEGSKFLGWYIERDPGRFVEYNFNKKVYTDITIHALWSSPVADDIMLNYTEGIRQVKIIKKTAATVTNSSVRFYKMGVEQGGHIIKGSPWEYAEAFVYGMFPFLVILLGIELFRDFIAIRYYYRIRKLAMRGER